MTVSQKVTWLKVVCLRQACKASNAQRHFSGGLWHPCDTLPGTCGYARSFPEDAWQDKGPTRFALIGYMLRKELV